MHCPYFHICTMKNIKNQNKMKQLTFALLIGTTLMFSAFKIQKTLDWKIATPYSIKFSGTEVEGIFKTMNGDISFDETNLQNSKMSVKVDVASINTGNGMKNRHAKSEKWFDAEQFPQITFTSTQFTKSENGYDVKGFLNLHGVKKEIHIPFTFTSNTFNGSFTLKRLDYGVGTMKGMSKKVSNEIKIEIAVPVTKK